MHTRISNAELIKHLINHLRNRRETSVNITFSRNQVRIQSISEFIYETNVLLDSISDDYIGLSFSLMLDSSINLLDKDSVNEFTEIVVYENSVILKQNDVELPLKRTYDEYITVIPKSLDIVGDIDMSIFQDVVSSARKMINVSKALDVSATPVVLYGGRYYGIYSNTMLIKDIDMRLPNIEIPYTIFSNTVKGLPANKISLQIDDKSKLLFMNVQDNIKSSINYKSPKIEQLNSLNSKINSLTKVGLVDLSCINKLEQLYKCFPKEKVYMSINASQDRRDMNCSFNLHLNDGKDISINLQDPSIMKPLVNIVISTSQADLLRNVCYGFSVVEVYKGEDIICFKKENVLTLVLSGMTF